MSRHGTPTWLETADGQRLGLTLVDHVWHVRWPGGQGLSITADPADHAVTGLQLLHHLTVWAIKAQEQAPSLPGDTLLNTLRQALATERKRRWWPVEPLLTGPPIGPEATAEQLILLLVIVYGEAARAAPDTADSDKRVLGQLRDLLAQALTAEQRRTQRNGGVG